VKQTPRWLIERPISHRGLHSGDGICPENSMKAFENSLHECYPIELDVQLLENERVCVFHDLNALRMTGIDRLISECDTLQLKRMRLLGSDQHIPLLCDVLSLVDGRVPLLIELKSTGRPGALEEAVWKVLSAYRGEYALQSFNPRTLLWFRRNAPSVVRGQLSGDFRDEKMPIHKKLILKHMLLNRVTLPEFIGYDVRLMPSLLLSYQRNRGVPVLGWTVCSREEYVRVKPHCDNIIFELFRPEHAELKC
jgi:glycerophosphoryl diester phosphodiesterase